MGVFTVGSLRNSPYIVALKCPKCQTKYFCPSCWLYPSSPASRRGILLPPHRLNMSTSARVPIQRFTTRQPIAGAFPIVPPKYTRLHWKRPSKWGAGLVKLNINNQSKSTPMFRKRFIIVFAIPLLIGCNGNSKSSNSKATPVGENTFVYNGKLYKLLNNELLQISNLDSSRIRKLEISKPTLKNLGDASIDYIKKGASGTIKSVYRGNFLYFRLRLDGINDLKENYYPGKFTVEFLDEYGFVINAIDILTSELVGEMNEDGKIQTYEYNGKIEISIEAEAAISKCSISSTVRQK